MNMKLKLTRHYNPHFTFIAATIFSLCLQIRANYLNHARLTNESYLDPITQNISENQNTTEANTNLIYQDTDYNESMATSEMQTATFQSLSSTFGQESSTSSPALKLTSAVQDPLSTIKTQITIKTEICEEKNKSLILICFIIIAVLVLACTFLFLSTVVMANKVSYLKRSKQGKRTPRSNADFLATNNLWPTGSDAWQRKSKELTGIDLMQDLISETAITVQTKTAVETTEKLTSGRANDEKNEASPKPCDSIITNFIVEI
ncbi:protein EVI2A [Emydura macquarii macquarii]|uniref:protein EVI2A n=1 Tax=Emydura macquarii macquarii TaxID=1129001 RepID=UPI00352A865C